jgi:hypothetical protein
LWVARRRCEPAVPEPRRGWVVLYQRRPEEPERAWTLTDWTECLEEPAQTLN